jgi:hypothetical protein
MTSLIVRGLLVRDGVGRLALTNKGRCALRALFAWDVSLTPKHRRALLAGGLPCCWLPRRGCLPPAALEQDRSGAPP